VELSEGRGAFSALIGCPVRDQNGRSLGRVFEVRAGWRGEVLEIEELLVGRHGIWRRLRGPGRAEGIPWAAVTDFTEDGIQVH
jgi:ribosomal 30S subunit maturation factor RimM